MRNQDPFAGKKIKVLAVFCECCGRDRDIDAEDSDEWALMFDNGEEQQYVCPDC